MAAVPVAVNGAVVGVDRVGVADGIEDRANGGCADAGNVQLSVFEVFEVKILQVQVLERTFVEAEIGRWTDEPTSGGGRKAPGGILSAMDGREKYCVSTDR